MSEKADNVRPTARALKRPRGSKAVAQVLPKLSASSAWLGTRRVAMWMVLLAAACALLFVFATSFGYSRWMENAEFLSMLKERDAKGTWITAVQGRWKDGSWQMRIREEPFPKDKKLRWLWGYNMTGSVFFQRLVELSGQGYKLVHQQSYTWPDGTKMYQVVWHKIDAQEN